LLFVSFTTPFIPNILISSLEDTYPVIADLSSLEKDSVHILVLGEGHSWNQKLQPNNQLTNIALGRLVEGVRIHKALPQSRLICSGGKGGQLISHADIQKRTALALGVLESRIDLLVNTENTRHEAKSYNEKYGNLIHLIVVTDACHMPRSMYAFHQMNLNPISAPTNHYLKDVGYYNWWALAPGSHNLAKAERAVYEYTGAFWYKISN